MPRKQANSTPSRFEPKPLKRRGTEDTDDALVFRFRRSVRGESSSETEPLGMRQLRQPANYFPQLYDLQVGRAALPVVYPADDEVSAARIMAMGEEVTAVKLKLNAHILPASGFHFQFCAAIRVADLGRFNDETQAPEKHAE